jgi:hypothetical protein
MQSCLQMQPLILFFPGGHRIVNEERNMIVYIVRVLAADEDFGGKHNAMAGIFA